MKRSRLVIIIAAICVFGLVGFVLVANLSGDKKKDDFRPTTNSASTSQADNAANYTPTPASSTPSNSSSNALIWRQGANGWEAQSTAPACPAQPQLTAPTDLTQATAVLYPGQTRGGTSYKPHGGLRFNNSADNAISVSSPIEGYVVTGARNLVDGGTEVQYSFSIMSNCGVMTTLGHLRELTPAFQKIADTFPEPTANSATQRIEQPIYVKQGELMATKVGTLDDHNAFFDWGVYDYRQQNEASTSADYQAAHGENNGKDTAWYAVCWLQGWLPAGDEALLSTLPPGDPTSGKNSDYCV